MPDRSTRPAARRLRASLAALAFGLAAAAALPAQAQQAPTTSPDSLEGGHFIVDKGHAKIIFSTTHFGFSTYYGLFTDFDAQLDFQPKTPAASALTVTVNLNGIDTTNPKLDQHLKSADFFNVAEFPTASFKATDIKVTGPASGTITGDLTLHGVTHPVTLDATFNGGGTNPMSHAYVLGFNATGTLKRSDFGIKTYVPAVGDTVTLTISAEFDRAQ